MLTALPQLPHVQSLLDAVIAAGGCMVIPEVPGLSDDELLSLSSDIHPLRLEYTAAADIILMAPTGSISGIAHAQVYYRIKLWTDQDGTGVAFGSDTGWKLPSGAVRAPDAAWLPRARYLQFSEMECRRFLPLCPDFVAEVKSPSDRLTGALGLFAKMDEWMAAGARLGWLIDPDESQAWVYRPGLPTEHLTGPDLVLLGYDVLPGCAIALADLVRL